MILPDVLVNDLKVVFCGTAVGAKSAERSAYYAGPGNKFYRTIHAIGLTPRRLEPHEYKELPEYGIGLTDMAKKVYGNDDVLNSSHFDVEGFQIKILQYQPKLVCFNGKAAASVFMFGRKNKTKAIGYGLLPKKMANTKFYVLPSTSGAANGSWDVKYWKNLINHI